VELRPGRCRGADRPEIEPAQGFPSSTGRGRAKAWIPYLVTNEIYSLQCEFGSPGFQVSDNTRMNQQLTEGPGAPGVGAVPA
jgi:hypothetical protein